MQRLLLILILLFFCFDGIAQSPFGINYQAIARDSDGNELPNDGIEVMFEIREGSANGTVAYSELHAVVTNDFGLFNIVIGQGDNASSEFSSINWGSNTFFLATLISDNGGGSFDEISVVQLISVPYALHANTVSNADDADADPTNETNLSLNFNSSTNELSVTDLDGVLTTDLSSLDDNDGDPQNESLTDIQLDGTQLVLTESGMDHPVDLAPIVPPSFWLGSVSGSLYYTGNSSVGIGENNSNPNSTLDIDGSVSFNTEVINSVNPLVPSATSSHFLIDYSSNTPYTIELPSSFDSTGRKYVFIFRNTVNHSINFLTADSSNIDSAPTKTFSSSHGERAFSVISFGSQGWFFIDGL